MGWVGLAGWGRGRARFGLDLGWGGVGYDRVGEGRGGEKGMGGVGKGNGRVGWGGGRASLGRVR